ncbi:MAG TPA: PilN domain-containing protein [Phycisphaerales bacterium]|nr:PilN domain-containing protein [Phycisphaerales bacterium]
MAFFPQVKQDNAAGTGASFLPADYIQRKAEFRNNIIILSLFAVVLAGVGGAFVLNNTRKVKLGAEYRELVEQCKAEEAKIEQLKKLTEQRAMMLEKAEITAALVEKMPRWALLGEVVYRMPDEMRLEDLGMKGTRNTTGGVVSVKSEVKSLTQDVADKQAAAARPKVQAPSFTYDIAISGTAKDNNQVADYLGSLKRSPALRDVELTYIKEMRDKETSLRKFEMTARLRSDVPKEQLGASIRELLATKSGKTPDGAAPMAKENE